MIGKVERRPVFSQEMLADPESSDGVYMYNMHGALLQVHVTKRSF
jgi:hypothetical protein